MLRPAAPFLAALAVTLLVVAAFASLVRQPNALVVDDERVAVDEFVKPCDASPGNDLTRLYLPLHLRIGAVLARTGRLPGWDPAGFGGRPLVGNPQAGLWYPPFWLVWWSHWPAALSWLTVAHLVVGGLGVLALGRLLRLGWLTAGVAAGVFVLSPYVLAQVAEGHLPHVWSVCWFPWVFLAIVRARRARSARCWPCRRS